MTTVNEIAPDFYRISTYIPEAELQFNQFLIDDDEPVLFHTGMKVLFPLCVKLSLRHRSVDLTLDQL
jgi:hypothetical protein